MAERRDHGRMNRDRQRRRIRSCARRVRPPWLRSRWRRSRGGAPAAALRNAAAASANGAALGARRSRCALALGDRLVDAFGEPLEAYRPDALQARLGGFGQALFAALGNSFGASLGAGGGQIVAALKEPPSARAEGAALHRAAVSPTGSAKVRARKVNLFDAGHRHARLVNQLVGAVGTAEYDVAGVGHAPWPRRRSPPCASSTSRSRTGPSDSMSSRSMFAARSRHVGRGTAP